jgi:cilia- and flagella-associated protein 52
MSVQGQSTQSGQVQAVPSSVELEHMLGNKISAQCHPSDERVYVTALGPLVVIADVLDPHAQFFLRAHDADVTALEVSSSGRFLASGQARSPNAPSGDSVCIVWDFAQKRAVYNFYGILGGVTHVRFSPDEKMLAAVGVDMNVFVWDLATGEQVYNKQFTTSEQRNGVAFLSWGPIVTSSVSKRPAYTFAFNVFERVHVAVFEFDFRIMRYNHIIHPALMPSSGYLRTYTSGVFDPAGNMVLCGTTAGEVAVFYIVPGGLQYKTALLASSGGVHCLTSVKASIDSSGRTAIYVGGGDGSIRCFTGVGLDWVCTAETRTYGRVTGMSLAGGSAVWMLVTTSSGLLYRVSFGGNLHMGAMAGGRTAVDLLEAAHTGSVIASAFNPSSPACVATISTDRSLRLWNLNTYGVTWTAALPNGLNATAVWVADPIDEATLHSSSSSSNSSSSSSDPVPGIPCDIYAGFSDGSLRSYSITPATVAAASHNLQSTGGSGVMGGQLENWRINAHKGAVSCITGNRAIIVTGGPDGRVLVWARHSHDLLLTFNDHTKPLVSVQLDCKNPEILYSVGQDRIVNTYSMRAERRLRLHALPQPDATACFITAMTQLTADSSERELVCGTSDGRLFLFDPAVPDTCVGSIDLLSLLVLRARASRDGTFAPVQGEDVDSLVPKLRPGQSRAELRISSIATSPSGRFVAVATACSRLIILSLPPPGTSFVHTLRSTIGGPTSDQGSLTRRATVVDQAGKHRQLVTSPATLMKIVAFLNAGKSPFTDVKWAPDEHQLILSCSDSLIAVVNFYGSE